MYILHLYEKSSVLNRPEAAEPFVVVTAFVLDQFFTSQRLLISDVSICFPYNVQDPY